jgi:hypothetical protein
VRAQWRFASLLGIAAVVCGTATPLVTTNAVADEGTLMTTIAALDAKVFEAYNHCDLETFSRFFTPTVEFYHDQGGASFDRATVVENTKKFVCHKIRRELVPGTFNVYPIKDYGAIEEGEHRFCQVASGQCEGIAKFVMIWRHDGDEWVLTRVLSYGHRALHHAGQGAPAPSAAH